MSAKAKSASSKAVAVTKSVVKKPVIKKAKPSPAKTKKTAANDDGLNEMFDLAAEIFRVMSAPMRLKIINCLCTEEKNVGQLLEEIDTTQPNMSQHLNTLYAAGILGKRREGVQMYYRIVNARVVSLCRAICVEIETDLSNS